MNYCWYFECSLEQIVPLCCYIYLDILWQVNFLPQILDKFLSLLKAAAHQKYSKWKAAYIHKCLKSGETPVPGPAGGDTEAEGGDSPYPPYPSNTQQPPGYPTNTQQPPGYPTDTQQPPGYPTNTQQPPGYPTNTQQPPGYPTNTQQPPYPTNTAGVPGQFPSQPFPPNQPTYPTPPSQPSVYQVT